TRRPRRAWGSPTPRSSTTSRGTAIRRRRRSRSCTTRRRPPGESGRATSSASRRSAPGCTGARRSCAYERRPAANVSAAANRPRPAEPDAFPGWLLAAWAVTGIVLVVVAVLSIRRDREATREDWRARLSHMADDRAALAERTLHSWREHVHALARLESV